MPRRPRLTTVELGLRGRQLAPSSRSKRHRLPVRIFLFPFSTLAECVIPDYAPLFSISWCRTVGSHQSPIRFKALGAVLYGQRSPAPGNLDCPRKLSVPRRVQGYRITDPLALPVRGPTLLWLTAWAYHRITAPPSCRYVKGRDSGQSDHVVLSQPAAKLTVPSQPLNFSVETPW